jgi:hypothetical protein
VGYKDLAELISPGNTAPRAQETFRSYLQIVFTSTTIRKYIYIYLRPNIIYALSSLSIKKWNFIVLWMMRSTKTKAFRALAEGTHDQCLAVGLGSKPGGDTQLPGRTQKASLMLALRAQVSLVSEATLGPWAWEEL